MIIFEVQQVKNDYYMLRIKACIIIIIIIIIIILQGKYIIKLFVKNSYTIILINSTLVVQPKLLFFFCTAD